MYTVFRNAIFGVGQKVAHFPRANPGSPSPQNPFVPSQAVHGVAHWTGIGVLNVSVSTSQ